MCVVFQQYDVISRNPLFEMLPPNPMGMRRKWNAVFLFLVLSFALCSPLLSSASARSVHETSSYDLFPQGDLTDSSQWTVGATTSFTSQPATYTDSMVADQRITMVHQRPHNTDTLSYWGLNSPSESDNVIGAPDGLFMWSTGPVMSVQDFDVTSSNQYVITGVSVVLAFKITDALNIDSVRLSMDWSNGTEILRTWSNTGAAIDYINGTHYSYDISSVDSWTWAMLSNAKFTMDYVSVGQTDDARLELDAIGIEVTMETPWYGGEVAQATSTATGHDLPVIDLDLSFGDYNGISLSICGLESSDGQTIGSWTSEPIDVPAEQSFGRIHYVVNESGTEENVSVQYATSSDGIAFSSFAMYDGDVLPDVDYVKVRVSTDVACIVSVHIDINDPTLTIAGRIYGDASGINATLSRWTITVNDITVANLPVALGQFSHQIPIGHSLLAENTDVEVTIKTWFTWDSDGSASTTAMEVNSIDISGGYDIFYDEDPFCQLVGDQYLTEDGGGLFVPLLTRCTDDRGLPEDLVVSFVNSEPDIVDVSLDQGEVRISLQSEQSGASQISMTVSDAAGNSHTEVFNVFVESVDDQPVLNEFPAVVQVEHALETTIPFAWSDVDSAASTMTMNTNRSWVEVDLDAETLTLTAPTPGYTSVLLTLCDSTSCSERILDLHVVSLPDLEVTDLVVGDDSSGIVVESESAENGQFLKARVYVANYGYANAEMVTIRCIINGQTADIATITTLGPGEIAVAECSFQTPIGGDFLLINAIVDGGQVIDERNESNNEMEKTLTLVQPENTDQEDVASGVSTTTIYVGSLITLIVIIAGFRFLAPAKIRKYDGKDYYGVPNSPGFDEQGKVIRKVE